MIKSKFKLWLFIHVTPIIVKLPRVPLVIRMANKLYLWMCDYGVYTMLTIYDTYRSAISANDVAEILKADGWTHKQIALIHELCLHNKFIEYAPDKQRIVN